MLKIMMQLVKELLEQFCILDLFSFLSIRSKLEAVGFDC